MDELIKEHGEVIRAVLLSSLCVAITMIMIKASIDIQLMELGRLL